MAQYAGLIERLEKAEGPDRELDCRIAIAVGDWVFADADVEKQIDYFMGSCPVEDEAGLRPYKLRADQHGVKHYTASIDAALTLVPEGEVWMLMRHESGAFYAEVDDASQHKGATPAIALCIAALKARAVSVGQTAMA